MNKVYTLQEVAAHLRVPHSVVRDAVFAGRWPHLQISPRRRFMTQENLDETIALLSKPAGVEESAVAARTTRDRVKGLMAAA
jgi:hypothetical protein